MTSQARLPRLLLMDHIYQEFSFLIWEMEMITPALRDDYKLLTSGI